jgi:hypothetical protein
LVHLTSNDATPTYFFINSSGVRPPDISQRHYFYTHESFLRDVRDIDAFGLYNFFTRPLARFVQGLRVKLDPETIRLLNL